MRKQKEGKIAQVVLDIAISPFEGKKEIEAFLNKLDKIYPIRVRSIKVLENELLGDN